MLLWTRWQESAASLPANGVHRNVLAATTSESNRAHRRRRREWRRRRERFSAAPRTGWFAAAGLETRHVSWCAILVGRSVGLNQKQSQYVAPNLLNGYEHNNNL